MFISCQDSHNTHTSENLTGHLWTLQSFEPQGEGKIPVNKNEVYTLEFFEDSTLKGQSDCNTYAGRYEPISKDLLKFQILFITEVYCGDSQDEIYDGALRSTVSYQIKKK